MLLAGGEPPDVAARMDAWEVWLASDPADTAEARAADLDRHYLEQEVA